MHESYVLECPQPERTILEYGAYDRNTGDNGCSIEIVRKISDSGFKYDVYADFHGHEEAADYFDYEMYHVNNIFSESLDYDGNVHLQCDYNPRDIIEKYLGQPDRAYSETKN